jgi:hypothetical protein
MRVCALRALRSLEKCGEVAVGKAAAGLPAAMGYTIRGFESLPSPPSLNLFSYFSWRDIGPERASAMSQLDCYRNGAQAETLNR